MRDVIVDHARRYPLWGVDDVYKLIYQVAMGSEHAAADETAARAWLTRELGVMGSGPDEPLVDPISPDGSVVRIHLRPYARLGLDAETLLAAFLRTAREFRGSVQLLEDSLANAARLAGDGLIVLDRAELGLYAARMKASGFPAVHHSATYAAAYRPAYRVVARAFLLPDIVGWIRCSEPLPMREDVHRLCREFVRGLVEIFGSRLHAAYVYGALTFPETVNVGDVDFHVVLASPPSDAERAATLGLHDRLAREFPPLGAELDGYYILLAECHRSERPRHLLFPDIVDDSWALHRAHILAGRVIVLHGPDPRTIYAAPSWPEIDDALRGELDYVEAHLAQYPAYCVLNLCRLMYSHETGDVVTSKAAAAAWGLDRLPAWRSLIEAARRSYAHEDTAEDRAALSRDVRSFYGFGCAHIAALSGKGPSAPRRGER
jgi:hypothetical protein